MSEREFDKLFSSGASAACPRVRLGECEVTLRPCLIRTYLHRYLGAKFCRKVCKFICQPICCSFGRYRPSDKAQSHLQGCPPTRYQNKDNLHATRSAKQLQCY